MRSIRNRSIKTIFFFIITLLITTSDIWGQQIYFPHSNYIDSASFANAAPTLARQVMLLYKEKDNEGYVYLDNLFRLQIVAKDYVGAMRTLDSAISKSKDQNHYGAEAMGIQFRSYVLTVERQKNNPQSFEKLYASILEELYDRLPETAKPSAASYFSSYIPSLKSDFEQNLFRNAQKARDSISLEDARLLCKSYNSYNVYNRIRTGKDILAAIENNKYLIEDSILIPVGNGAVVSALVVRIRKNTQPLPAVLRYNIYAGDADLRSAKFAADKGYIGISVNTRGKKHSPQEIEPFEHDGADAYQIIDWISKQPYCNGKIGMYGGSYLGFGQWSAVKKIHPALKTIVPQVSVGIGIDYPAFNNVFGSYMLRWIRYVQNNKFTDGHEFGDKTKWDSVFKKYYTIGVAFHSLDSLEGHRNIIFQRWLQHASYDTFWKSMIPYKQEFANINIPVLTTTGYFDDDQRGAMYYFDQHHTYNKNANHYLVIGPYDHGGAQSAASPKVGGYKIDSVANININEIVFQWFDYIMKGGTKPAMLKDRINYQVMGTNEWKHAPSLSKMNNDTLTFYLSNVSAEKSYKLQSLKPVKTDYILQEIHLADRSDLDSTEKNDDNVEDSVLKAPGKLIFMTEPIDKPVTINGSFFGELKTIINKKDFDYEATLYEWMPNGKYHRLSVTSGRASYMKNREKRELLRPGVLETIPVTNSFFTSKKLAMGSRIVLVIGIQKSPHAQINYGTGKDVSDETIADGKIPVAIQWSNQSFIKVPVFKD